jgi:hypothetical protein
MDLQHLPLGHPGQFSPADGDLTADAGGYLRFSVNLPMLFEAVRASNAKNLVVKVARAIAAKPAR